MTPSSRKRHRLLLLLLLFLPMLLLFFLFLLLLWGSGGFQSPGTSTGPIAVIGEPAKADSVSTLRVMTWNIGYGYGVGSMGAGYATKSKEEIDRAITAMGELIRRDSIDIVLIQEIDFDSKRSGGTDQLRLLAEVSGLPYTARAVSWDANYVPFPYWPPRDHFGRVLSGAAVLSRFPIIENTAERLPKPDSNPWFYNMFYLFRMFQTVGVEIGDRTYFIANHHLESFDKHNRMEQALLARRRLAELAQRGDVLLFGGDLNSVPETAEKRSGFIDSPEDNYEADSTLAVFRGIPGFRELITAEEYASNPSPWDTYPANAPTRRVDFLFINSRFEVVGAKVVTEAGTLSDHLPVMAEVRIR